MIINRDGIWCWYMMFEISIFYYGIWCSHMMFTCDTQIPTFHFRIWCSHVICTIIVYDVGIWSSVYDVGIWSSVYDVCIWCSHVISYVKILDFVYEVLHMMFTCDVICEDFRFGIWSWYMIITHDLARWSYDLPYVIIYALFLNIFISQKYRIWCSHVNIFVYDVHMWTLFPMRWMQGSDSACYETRDQDCGTTV